MKDVIRYLCPICGKKNWAMECGGHGMDDKPGYCKRHPQQKLILHSFKRGFIKKTNFEV